jgi:hypothetical protein
LTNAGRELASASQSGVRIAFLSDFRRSSVANAACLERANGSTITRP